MQQSTDPYYVEIANYPNQMHQQQADQIIYPVVPQDNYLINSDYNENNEVNSTRLKILFNYYIKQIFQIIGITLIFGINQIHGFSSIYLSEVDTEWWGSSFTYAKFRMFYDDKATIQEYYDWKEEKRREYIDYQFNWVYYFIVAFTLFFTLSVAFVRNSRSFAQNQFIFLIIQTVLLGIILGGVASVFQNSRQYKSTVSYILLALQGLITNAIFNLVLIKKSKTQVYGKLKFIFTYFFSDQTSQWDLRNITWLKLYLLLSSMLFILSLF